MYSPSTNTMRISKNASMKTVIVLFCVLCFVCCGVSANQATQTCLEQMGLTIADLPSLIPDSSPEIARKRGCLEACVMQKTSIMDGNVINVQKIDEMLDKLPNGENKETIRNTVHQCANEAANDDPCVVAQNFARCGLEHLKLTAHQLLP